MCMLRVSFRLDLSREDCRGWLTRVLLTGSRVRAVLTSRASVLNDETEAHRSARLLEHQGTFIFRHAVFSVLITRGE